MKNLTQAIVIK